MNTSLWDECDRSRDWKSKKRCATYKTTNLFQTARIRKDIFHQCSIHENETLTSLERMKEAQFNTVISTVINNNFIGNLVRRGTVGRIVSIDDRMVIRQRDAYLGNIGISFGRLCDKRILSFRA
jgi:hypothetical protein